MNDREQKAQQIIKQLDELKAQAHTLQGHLRAARLIPETELYDFFQLARTISAEAEILTPFHGKKRP